MGLIGAIKLGGTRLAVSLVDRTRKVRGRVTDLMLGLGGKTAAGYGYGKAVLQP